MKMPRSSPEILVDLNYTADAFDYYSSLWGRPGYSYDRLSVILHSLNRTAGQYMRSYKAARRRELAEGIEYEEPREIREIGRPPEKPPEEIGAPPVELPMYQSFLITFSTPKGADWVATTVEIWGEITDYKDNMPTQAEIQNMIEDSLPAHDWDWILNMRGYKFAIEEQSPTDERARSEIRITIRRLTDYRMEDSWKITY